MAFYDSWADAFRKKEYKDFEVNTEDLMAAGREGRKARREADRISRQMGDGTLGALSAMDQEQAVAIREGRSPFEQDSAETTRRAAEAASAQSGAAASQTQDLVRESRAGGGMSQGSLETAIRNQMASQQDSFLKSYANEAAQARAQQFENEMRVLEQGYTQALQAMERDMLKEQQFVNMLVESQLGAAEGVSSGMSMGGGAASFGGA